MMYKVILKYDKKGRAARISGGRPAFNIQQDHTLPVMVFLFFSQLLRVGIDIHPAPVFLGMQPFPLFEHDKRNTRRDDRNQHDQSGHETHEAVGDDKSDDGSAGTLRAALQDPVVVQRLAGLSSDVPPPDKITPQGLKTHLEAEIAKWGPVIRKAGIYAD